MSYKLQWDPPDESVVISYLSELYSSKQFADTTLVCKDKRKIQAHGAILAATSKMFHELLKNSEDMEIVFDEVSFEEMEMVLELLYTGEVQIKDFMEDNLITLGKSLGFECFYDLERLKDPLDIVIFNEDQYFNEAKVEKKYKDLEQSFAKSLEKRKVRGGKKYKALVKCSHGHEGMCYICLCNDKGQTKIVSSKQIQFGKKVVLEQLPQKAKPEILKEENSPIKIEFKQNNSFKCPECPKTFALKTSIRTHVELVHRGVRYVCDYCSKMFPKNKDLQNHVNVVHLGMSFNCQFCEKKLTTKTALDFHIENIHKRKRYECEECHKSYCSKNILKQHYEGVHKGVRYPCPECDYKALDPSNLNIHMHRLHPGLKETKRKSLGRVAKKFNAPVSPKLKIEF